LIDWLVFNANFSNISAISWRIDLREEGCILGIITSRYLVVILMDEVHIEDWLFNVWLVT
jgi:hypothetical protein